MPTFDIDEAEFRDAVEEAINNIDLSSLIADAVSDAVDFDCYANHVVIRDEIEEYDLSDMAREAVDEIRRNDVAWLDQGDLEELEERLMAVIDRVDRALVERIEAVAAARLPWQPPAPKPPILYTTLWEVIQGKLGPTPEVGDCVEGVWEYLFRLGYVDVS